jgi:intracellular septation protein A
MDALTLRMATIAPRSVACSALRMAINGILWNSMVMKASLHFAGCLPANPYVARRSPRSFWPAVKSAPRAFFAIMSIANNNRICYVDSAIIVG